MLKEGGDYGWPTCYFDPTQKKLVLSPEYGGDGGKKTDDCAKFEAPVATFPAHWAPNDLKIYKASQFPKSTKEAPSSPSTARGTERRRHKADTMSFSSRWPTARRPVTTLSSPTVSPAHLRIRDGRRTPLRPGSRAGRHALHH